MQARRILHAVNALSLVQRPKSIPPLSQSAPSSLSDTKMHPEVKNPKTESADQESSQNRSYSMSSRSQSFAQRNRPFFAILFDCARSQSSIFKSRSSMAG